MFRDEIYICNYYSILWKQNGPLSTLDVNGYLGLALDSRSMCFIYLRRYKGREGYFIVRSFLRFLYKALSCE